MIFRSPVITCPDGLRKLLHIPFANKGIDAINISNILNRKEVVKEIYAIFIHLFDFGMIETRKKGERGGVNFICVGVSPLQLVNLHRNRRYFVIKLHTWFCLSYHKPNYELITFITCLLQLKGKHIDCQIQIRKIIKCFTNG
jgi:predicted transcriptional regulator